MHISRVHIRNFRNFRDLTIDPFPRNAVLVGENAIGKSNLIHALRLVLDPDLPDSARMLRAEDICEHSGASLQTGVEVRVEVDLTDFDGNPELQGTLDGCLISLAPLTARISFVFKPAASSQEGELSIDDYGFEITGGISDAGNGRRIRASVPLTVLPALRDATNELSRWRGSPLHDLLEARKPDRSVLAATAVQIERAMKALAAEGQVVAVEKDLATRVSSMAGPQLRLTPTLGFTSSDPDRLLRSIRLFVDENGRRGVSDASTGNANVLYLGLLLERLVSRRNKVKDRLLEPILAVEEPEAHLHPVLQRQLFRYLLRMETSLMVSTHSPHIAAVTSLDSLVLLRPDAFGGTTAATTAGMKQLSDRDRKDLERYLNVSRAELLFCTAAILVEGPSEVYLLPALATALGFDLDAHGVIIANIEGTNFAPYRALLGPDALDVPHAIITDGDPYSRGKRVEAGLTRAINLLPTGPLKDQLDESLKRILPGKDVAGTSPIRFAAAQAGIFVGHVTLEVDVLPLLADPMINAHSELETSSDLSTKFAAAVGAILTGAGQDDDEKELLRRINHVSKGRYAQRLADHVESSKTDIESIIAKAAFHLPIPDSTAGEFTTQELLSLGTYGYLLAALDRVSRQVRGRGLVSRTAQNPGCQEEQ
ncbi:AAA family ATPase [Microbispora sp. NEAU-D428]|uniref:ATP-dependent nuclease n=1 Tax=Microbispora sitophila TaxID=2771537 RepID=UPI001868A30A|nr:AAA family ATPase [Microbispora sitophila]MBE3016080.1 AAA family ATPase [Microbispora sitophila]